MLFQIHLNIRRKIVMKISDFNVEDYYYLNRRFQLLFYQISHGELIIRSQKNDNYVHTIDIYFGDVIYMEIPSELNGIRFRRANADDVSYINSKIKNYIIQDNIVVIISEEKEYYIVASVISINENDLSFVELPIHCFLHGI